MKHLKKLGLGLLMVALVFGVMTRPAKATLDIKAITTNAVFSGNFVNVLVDYYDPNINAGIDTQTFSVYLGNSGGLFVDSNNFLSSEVQSGLESQILSYASGASYTMNASDIIWESINTLTPAEENYLKTAMPIYWHNGVLQSSLKHITFSGTTTSGTVVFYLTDNGASNGNALCSSTPKHVNVTANDPNNTLGLGWAVTNSNKTLTITANARSFSSTTILGISVLGSSSLSAVANGTSINVAVDCN